MRGMHRGLLYDDENDNKNDATDTPTARERRKMMNCCPMTLLFDIIMVFMENEFSFCHGVKSSFPNHYPIPLTLAIRQARRYTTSCQVHLGT